MVFKRRDYIQELAEMLEEIEQEEENPTEKVEIFKIDGRSTVRQLEHVIYLEEASVLIKHNDDLLSILVDAEVLFSEGMKRIQKVEFLLENGNGKTQPFSPTAELKNEVVDLLLLPDYRQEQYLSENAERERNKYKFTSTPKKRDSLKDRVLGFFK